MLCPHRHDVRAFLSSEVDPKWSFEEQSLHIPLIANVYQLFLFSCSAANLQAQETCAEIILIHA